MEDSEVQDFITSVKLIFPRGIDKGMTVGCTIVNNNLKMRSVYGVEYGGAFGRQNVTVVMQGPIDIRGKASIIKYVQIIY